MVVMDAIELLKEKKKYAESQGFKLYPDEKMVMYAIKGLLKNEKRYGHQYCPCRPVTGNEEEDAPKICPCKWHKDEIKKMGHCLCRLFAAQDFEITQQT